MLNRRSFLTASACIGAAALAARADQNEKPSAAAHKKRIKLGIATYSYWHFRTEKVSIETVIEKAADLGVEGLDILHRQMDIPEKEPLTADHRAYLHRLKRHAFRNGIAPACLSIHQNFVHPDATERQKQIEHTHKCIEIAYELGIPCIRLNSGRFVQRNRLAGHLLPFERVNELLHRGRKHLVLLIDHRERTRQSAILHFNCFERVLGDFLRYRAERHNRNTCIDFDRALHRFDIIEFHHVLYFHSRVLQRLVDRFPCRNIRFETHELLAGQILE